MMGRTVIGTARCLDGDNPVPVSSGWSIHTGGVYRVLRCRESEEDGTVWLTVLGDDGNAGNYEAWRFDWKRQEALAA